MPEISPQLRRGLVALAAVLLFAGAVGAAMIANDDDKPDVVAGPGATTTLIDGANGVGDAGGSPDTTVGAVTGSTTRARGETGATGRSGGSAPTSAPSKRGCSTSPAGARSTDADPGAPKPPTPGGYTYDTVTTGDFSQPCSAAETKIETGADGNGVTRRSTTQGSPEGTVTFHDAWSAEAVRQERLVITSAFGTIECDWDPDPTVLVFPLAVGKSWSGDSSCTTTVQGAPFRLRAQGTGRVTGRMQIAVGTDTVNVWVIESTIKATTTGAVNRTTEQTGVAYFAPTHGIDVYAKSTTKSDGGSFTSERRLLSLNPS